MTGGDGNRTKVAGRRHRREQSFGVMAQCLMAILASGPLSDAAFADNNWVTTVAPGADEVRIAAAEARAQEANENSPAKIPAPPPAPTAKPAPAAAPLRANAGSVSVTPASESKRPAEEESGTAPVGSPPHLDEDELGGETARQYCRVVLDRATRERLASESEATEVLKKDIDKRLSKLNAAVAEHETWLKRRQDFQKKAQDGLVKVYASMAAEAAALRLAATDESVAAAILSLLTPKAASAVLSEMPPEKAARLTAYLAGAAALRSEDAKPEKGARP